MLARLMRFAREGSLAVALAVAVAGAPVAAEASFWSDLKDAAEAAPVLFNPSHPVGKMLSGAVLWGGGWAGAAAVSSLALPPMVFATGIAIGVVGIGLIGWGIYELARDTRVADGGRTQPGTTPGGGGSGGGSGGGTIPGGGNPNPPGGGGNPSTGRDVGGANRVGDEGINIDRGANTRVGTGATSTDGTATAPIGRPPVRVPVRVPGRGAGTPR